MIDIKKLIENASLGDYLTIGGIAFSALGAAFALWRKYKNRHAEIRKGYLKRINAAYHLFEYGRSFIYIPERGSDSARLVQEIETSLAKIKAYHSEQLPEALGQFDVAYSDLTSSWDRELNIHWQQWCDSSKGNAYMNGTRNWNAFSISRFYDVYDSMRGKLNILRKQVRDSIP